MGGEIVPLELGLLGVLFKLEKQETIQTQGSSVIVQGTSSLDTRVCPNLLFWHSKIGDILWVYFFFFALIMWLSAELSQLEVKHETDLGRLRH